MKSVLTSHFRPIAIDAEDVQKPVIRAERRHRPVGQPVVLENGVRGRHDAVDDDRARLRHRGVGAGFKKSRHAGHANRLRSFVADADVVVVVVFIVVVDIGIDDVDVLAYLDVPGEDRDEALKVNAGFVERGVVRRRVDEMRRRQFERGAVGERERVEEFVAFGSSVEESENRRESGFSGVVESQDSISQRKRRHGFASSVGEKNFVVAGETTARFDRGRRI